MSVIRWNFTELGTATPASYTVEINPDGGGSPTRSRQMYSAVLSGPGSTTIAQAGRLDPEEIDFSGVILSQQHYQAFDLWAQKNTIIQLTDDLQRQFIGIFTSFVPTRVRSATKFWRHTYEAKFLVTGLAPQGLPPAISTTTLYVSDGFDRPENGAVITNLFGNDPLSNQAYFNATPEPFKAYHRINYSGGVGQLYRYQLMNPNDFYCTTSVPVVQDGDVHVAVKIVFPTTQTGTIGIYARSAQQVPMSLGDDVDIVGGGYILELNLATKKITLSNFGVGEIGRYTVPGTIAANSTYVMALRCAGPTLSGFFYPLNGSQINDPTIVSARPQVAPCLTVNDIAYANPGYVGISSFGNQSQAVYITDFVARSL